MSFISELFSTAREYWRLFPQRAVDIGAPGRNVVVMSDDTPAASTYQPMYDLVTCLRALLSCHPLVFALLRRIIRILSLCSHNLRCI